MKYLLTCVLGVLLPLSAMASGKISLQGNWYNEGKDVRPVVAIQAYEKVAKNLYLNAWAGYGNQFLEVRDDVDWAVAKAQIDMRMKQWTFSPGVQYKYLIDSRVDDVIPYLKADYQLW